MTCLAPARSSFRSVLVLSLLALVLAACDPATTPPPADSGVPEADTGPGADTGPPGTDAGPDAVPLFRNPLSTPDAELAMQALRLLGSTAAGGSGSCSDCHSVSRQRIAHWRALADTALASCLADLTVPDEAAADAILTCVRGGATGRYDAANLGPFAIAIDLPWFQFVVRRSVGDAAAAAEHAMLSEDARMPPDTAGMTPWTQADFDIVAEWFVRGAPGADDILPVDAPPTECTPGVSADVVAHVAEMATSGWSAVNAAAGLLSFGCAGAASARDCLATETAASSTAYGADWDVVPGTTMRVLYTTSYASAYWTRSSADGRFVGHGSETTPDRSRVIDLTTDVAIPADASYDPGFFPDNSGFVLMSGRGHFCEQSLLTGMPSRITFTEPECNDVSLTSVGLYQHVGAALSGGDYFAISGTFESDNGGHDATRAQPAAMFAASERTRITPLVNTGSGFTAMPGFTVPTPYEADAVIAPSGRYFLTRVAGPGGAQLGFVLRRIDATRNTDGTYTLEGAPEVARYCTNGGKPAFSLDERWLAVHRYVEDADAVELGFTGPTDPAFAAYRSMGASNVYLLDLATGETTRITNMGPGQYALYPHFRSDGWVYFLVRTLGSTAEHVVATEAALALAP